MNEEQNINQLPKDWKRVRLGDAGKIISGGTPSTTIPEYWNGNINWISPADLTGYKKKTIIKGAKSITDFGLKNSSARLMPKGSILFSSRAPIGYVAIASEELCTNQGFKSIIPNENVESEFLYYFLKASKQSAEKVASGTTFKEISLSKFAELDFPLPPKPTQKAIVSKIEELFSELDKGIEQLKAAQQQLKTYRQSVLKWAFEGKLTRGLNCDFYDLSDAHDLNIAAEPETAYRKNNDLPKGWKWSSLKELKLFSLYGPRFSCKDYTETGIAVLRTTDISERGKVDWDNSPKLNLSNDEYEKYKLIKNDLLITRTGSIGRLSIFNDNKKAIPGAFLIHYRLRDHLNILYIFHFFKSHKAQKHFAEHSSGIGRPNLNVPNIELLQIPLPSYEEQNKVVQEIESRLSVADKMEESITQSLQKAEALRQSILKKAFEGRLV